VIQILTEIGVAAAIAGKPVGQQMRIGGDIGFEEGSQLGPGRGRQHGDARIAGEEPVLAPDGVPMLSAPVLRRRHLFDGSDDQALVGVGRAATGACRVAAATNEGLVGFQKTVQRTRRILPQPVAQLVRHGPGRLIRHAEFALQKLGRNPALVAAHQIGSEKPLGQIGSRPVNTVPAVADSCRWQVAHSNTRGRVFSRHA